MKKSEFLKTLQAELERQLAQRDTIQENFSATRPEVHLIDPAFTTKTLLEFEKVSTTINTLRYAISVYEREMKRGAK